MKVWSLSTGNLKFTLKGHTSVVWCLAMYNEFLVSGSKDEFIKVWNLTSGEQVYSVEGHSKGVKTLAVS